MSPLWWHIPGGLVAFTALAVILWSLRGDRGQGRRCPKCWYSMDGIAGMRCPECGNEARHEQQFARRRRRWRLATIAIIPLILGLATASWPPLASGAIWQHIPTTALLHCHRLVPYIPERSRQAYAVQLWKRDLSVPQYNLLIWRIARVYADPEQGQRSRALSYELRHYRMAPDRSIVREGPRRFIWHICQTTDDAWTLIEPPAATALVDGLVVRWRNDPQQRSSWSRELRQLAFANDAAATMMLDRLFSEDLEWPLYLVHPMAKANAVMDVYLDALQSDDEVRRSRAAAALAAHYFEITTHNRDLAGPLVSIYPKFHDMRDQGAPAANSLLRATESPDRDRANTAAHLIAELGVEFRDQVLALEDRLDEFDADTVTALERLISILRGRY